MRFGSTYFDTFYSDGALMAVGIGRAHLARPTSFCMMSRRTPRYCRCS